MLTTFKMHIYLLCCPSFLLYPVNVCDFLLNIKYSLLQFRKKYERLTHVHRVCHPVPISRKNAMINLELGYAVNKKYIINYYEVISPQNLQ